MKPYIRLQFQSILRNLDSTLVIQMSFKLAVVTTVDLSANEMLSTDGRSQSLHHNTSRLLNGPIELLTLRIYGE